MVQEACESVRKRSRYASLKVCIDWESAVRARCEEEGERMLPLELGDRGRVQDISQSGDGCAYPWTETIRVAQAHVELRDLVPGDLGWVVQTHAKLDCAEHGWGPPYESLCARIVADFSPGERKRAWIASTDGERRGGVFLIRAPSDTFSVDATDADTRDVAKLRLFLVHPSARGFEKIRKDSYVGFGGAQSCCSD